jgi:beta-glucosidase
VETFKFSESFLWGAALSSYQTEGGNVYSDWNLWEKERGLEPCGNACDHYRLFREDFRIARQLNLKALRISLEWARICPVNKEPLQEELAHYVQVCDEMLKLGLKPVVTLHHFTNPVWFSKKNGWLDHKNIDSFLYYLKKTVEVLRDKVDTWLIINEPMVYVYKGYLEGSWPPGKKSLNDAVRVVKIFLTRIAPGMPR